MTDQPRLARRLGTRQAVAVGLGSMVGAGVFSAFGPAAQAAGSALLVGLALAAVVAYANATASAQLAARYPASGGTYVYGRERLGPWWGFVAGWAFVVGKTASCAAMALTFAAYVAPDGWQRPLAAGAVAAVAAVNYRGVTRTATATQVLVVVVLLVLGLVLAVTLGSAGPSWARLADGVPADLGWRGVVQSAALLFFAFAGYARVATLGEEVRDPARTIPRAVTLALALTVLLYAAVALTLLTVLGAAGTAASDAPLAAAAARASAAWAEPLVRVGAAVASLGALLALVAGVGRTVLAMAREGDLPRPLAAVHPRYRVPHRAEVVLALVVATLVLAVDVRGAIGFSSFGVLVYYLVANAAAWTQPAAERRYPRWLQAVGVLGCALLALSLPLPAVTGGVVVLVVGVGLRLARRRTGFGKP